MATEREHTHWMSGAIGWWSHSHSDITQKHLLTNDDERWPAAEDKHFHCPDCMRPFGDRRSYGHHHRRCIPLDYARAQERLGQKEEHHG